MLPKQAVIEFRNIYKDKVGLEINYKEAEKKANDFIQLYALITGIKRGIKQSS